MTMCIRTFDAGNDFPANQVTRYSVFSFAECQTLFPDVKYIHGGSRAMEHAVVILSLLRRSVVAILACLIPFSCSVMNKLC